MSEESHINRESEVNHDLEFAQRVVDYLNDLLEKDRSAIAALIANRVPCNESIADHSACQVVSQHGGFQVGLLGVINGMFPVLDGVGVIGAAFEVMPNGERGDLQAFRVNSWYADFCLRQNFDGKITHEDEVYRRLPGLVAGR